MKVVIFSKLKAKTKKNSERYTKTTLVASRMASLYGQLCMHYTVKKGVLLCTLNLTCLLC